ncbi:Mercuric reductase [bioreactor metagenome]|uniref:Mercuric reductase n=1 Tax=bioreactor metagenome TaxID=1076179 RepID=A0A644WZJ0_9ZZZZ
MSENAKDFDLIIIGGGSAGFAAAIKASQFNKKVAVVESGVIGGTCLNVGCVPTKNLLRAAEIYHFGQENPFEGINMKQVSLDFKEIIMQKDNLLAELRKEKYIDIYENDKNITLLKGKAEFINQDTIQINEEQYKASKYIITTGSRSSIAKIDGLGCVKYLTNIEIMELDKLPEKLIIIGGGWIAVEFAQMFSMFGSKVTILQRSGRIVKNEEPEISDALEKALKNHGINIVTDISFQKVYEENNRKYVTVIKDGNEQTFEGDQLLIATGRTPNSDNMGLEKAGVIVDEKGFIKINEYLQTSNPNVYAAGDVIGNYLLVTVNAHEGSVAGENATQNNIRKPNYKAVPHAIFTSPQVASVGLKESEAIELGLKVNSRTLDMGLVPKAAAIRNTQGFVKMIIDKDTKKILGVHVIGELAADIIQEATLALQFNLTSTDISNTIHVYPTMSEAIKLVAQSFDRDMKKLSCCAE